jgi:hypothetical protein
VSNLDKLALNRHTSLFWRGTNNFHATALKSTR